MRPWPEFNLWALPPQRSRLTLGAPGIFNIKGQGRRADRTGPTGIMRPAAPDAIIGFNH